MLSYKAVLWYFPSTETVQPGIITIIMVAVISAYCIDLLLKVKRTLQKHDPNVTTFGEIGLEISITHRKDTK